MQDTVTASFEGAARLPDWGVIRAAGPEAASFLHSQLTQDIVGLDVGRARLAGYCSAKGRLLASFVVWRASADELLLACSADLLAPTLKRLSMFVLRAKCRLSDASAERPLYGVVGSAARALEAAWQSRTGDHGVLIRMPDADGVPRALAIGDPALPSLDAAAWSWLEVGSGVPRIVAATVEQFVPQMVNLELVGGVNFQKGCYPGQEIVARSQYRGTLKRRAFLFSSEAAALPGQEIFHEADREQPAGLVANAASFDGRHRVLAELKLAVLGSGHLRLGVPDGPLLQREDLPYPVPLEVA